uniref:Uncharacterized protein n=1 Tax=Octopus bimaculoides TaxID=37653 RepID=A0A0L8G446_OCTBM
MQQNTYVVIHPSSTKKREPCSKMIILLLLLLFIRLIKFLNISNFYQLHTYNDGCAWVLPRHQPFTPFLFLLIHINSSS